MCDICGKNICDSRCPNAEEEKALYVCERCGGDIFADDEYFECSFGDKLCKKCLSEMSAMEFLIDWQSGLQKG